MESTVTCSPPLETPAELDQATVQLTKCIHTALENSTRFITTPVGKNDVPLEIRELIRRKNQARRAWQRYADVDARTTMNRLARQVKIALQDHRNERWNATIEAINADDSNPWRMARALRKKRTTIPPIHTPNGIVYSDEEKAEAFADRLELQTGLNYVNVDLDHVENTETIVRRWLRREDTSSPRHTTPTEIESLLKSLSPKKAPGDDDITNKALKNFGRKSIVALVNISNAALRHRYFPPQWKNAVVIFLPKPGQNIGFPQNYRPISLLSSIGKILERVILTRILEWMENTPVLPDEQHGFRSQHSTCHQLLRVTEYITQGFNRNQSTSAIFLDVENAFDKVWHDGLLYKLIQLDAPHWITHIIRSFLQNRQFKAKIGTATSTVRQIEAGVPQGSVLSPTLYNIFTHDIPKTNNTMMAQFADDTAILTRSWQPGIARDRLQEAADKLEEWFQKWRIRVNATKSAAVLFSRRKTIPNNTNINMFNESIPWKRSAKYLGVVMDSRLNWQENTTATINKARASARALYAMTNRRSKLSMANKLLLYKAIVRPILTYAAPIWGYAGDSIINRLHTTQNIQLRIAANAPWFVRNTQIHRDLNTPTIKNYIKVSSMKFYANVETHPNRSIKEAASDYQEDDQMKYKRPKLILLEQQ